MLGEWRICEGVAGGKGLIRFPKPLWSFERGAPEIVIVLSHLPRLEILLCALPCLDGSVKLLGSLCLRVDAQSVDRIWGDSERFLKPEEILHGVTCRVGRVTL